MFQIHLQVQVGNRVEEIDIFEQTSGTFESMMYVLIALLVVFSVLGYGLSVWWKHRKKKQLLGIVIVIMIILIYSIKYLQLAEVMKKPDDVNLLSPITFEFSVLSLCRLSRTQFFFAACKVPRILELTILPNFRMQRSTMGRFSICS